MDSLETLRRSTDAPIAGVCAGVARRYGVDPVLVRVVTVILVLSGGVGLVLYAAAWLLLPVEGSETPPLFRAIPAAAGLSRRTWVVLLIVVLVVFGGWFGRTVSLGIGPALVLGGIWYFGFYRCGRTLSGQYRPPVPGPGTSTGNDFQQAAQAWQARLDEARPAATPDGLSVTAAAGAVEPTAPSSAAVSTSTAGAAELACTSKQASDPRARVVRQVTIGVLLVQLVALAAVNVLVRPVPALAFLASSLLVVAAALIVGAWLGRPKGMLVLGAALTVAILVLGSPRLPVMQRTDMMGHRMTSYASVDQLPTTQNHGIGDLILDLSQLQVTAARSMNVSTGVGDIDVQLPATGNVRVEWSVGAGSVSTPNESRSGAGVSGIYERIDRPGEVVLVLQVAVGAGDLVLR